MIRLQFDSDLADYLRSVQPELRGRGYASALVAAISQRFVESGKRCLLFTDLANPTSNSIYQKVGYRPVADFRHVLFI